MRVPQELIHHHEPCHQEPRRTEATDSRLLSPKAVMMLGVTGVVMAAAVIGASHTPMG